MTPPGVVHGAVRPPDAPPVERQLAFDMVRRALPLVPVLVLGSALVWGGDGAWSAVVAVAIVLVNLVLAALALGWAATVSLTMLYVAALGGFLVRMALVVAVVFAVKDQPWADLTALGVCVLVTHLGLLAWETRYISASLAFPGLRPGTSKEAPPTR